MISRRCRILLGSLIFVSTVHVALAAMDPTTAYTRLFGLGGHTCRQEDDQGRLWLYTEGTPSSAVVAWLEASDRGTIPNIPMPQELADALPQIPPCLPGKHHA